MQILIVEDEVSLSNALKKILEDKGYFCDAVYDGQSAVDYISLNSYDLVVLDIMLPVLNGFEVLSRIRDMGIGTPILMLTARSAVSDKVDALTGGADDYMTKPFDIEEFSARVQALTRRRGELILNTRCFGDLCLNLKTSELICGEKSVHLSYKEFKVAELLFSNPDMIITKDVLINNVWGVDSEATDNNVEAYISFLRRKIKFLNSTVRIKNIQKIGYKPEADNDR